MSPRRAYLLTICHSLLAPFRPWSSKYSSPYRVSVPVANEAALPCISFDGMSTRAPSSSGRDPRLELEGFDTLARYDLTCFHRCRQCDCEIGDLCTATGSVNAAEMAEQYDSLFIHEDEPIESLTLKPKRPFPFEECSSSSDSDSEPEPLTQSVPPKTKPPRIFLQPQRGRPALPPPKRAVPPSKRVVTPPGEKDSKRCRADDIRRGNAVLGTAMRRKQQAPLQPQQTDTTVRAQRECGKPNQHTGGDALSQSNESPDRTQPLTTRAQGRRDDTEKHAGSPARPNRPPRKLQVGQPHPHPIKNAVS